jgi:DNA-binding transcriptional ArsR family regulator
VSVAAGRADAVFTALADPTRRGLLETLSRGGKATLSALATGLPMSRQAVAKHLVALREAELVSSERVGRNTVYELRPDGLADAASWIEMVGAEWDERLAALRESLDRRR